MRHAYDWFLPPLVVALILFLSLSTHYLVHALGPRTTSSSSSLSPRHQHLALVWLLACVLTTYRRACTTSPGRVRGLGSSRDPRFVALKRLHPGTRWCSRCRGPKPARAHHCVICRACVPRMDHHCVWTGNCVGMATLPHFVRFLLWANLGPVSYTHLTLPTICSV